MKVLRSVQPGEILFVHMLPGRNLRLQKLGKIFEYHVPTVHRFTRTSPKLSAFYGTVLSNSDFTLRIRPTQVMNLADGKLHAIAVVPYSAIKKVLWDTGTTNEDTVKVGRKIVVGDAFSSRRGIAWDNRKHVQLPMENPHWKPAERLFEEVLIG